VVNLFFDTNTPMKWLAVFACSGKKNIQFRPLLFKLT